MSRYWLVYTESCHLKFRPFKDKIDRTLFIGLFMEKNLQYLDDNSINAVFTGELENIEESFRCEES